MADFKAEVVELTIEEHPNADALELARVGNYVSIVRKGQFKTGDLGVYIPEQAVLPNWLIIRLGLEGRLAGGDHNRVKAVKLRGVLSQGLIYPLEPEIATDADFNTGISFFRSYWVLDFQDEFGPKRIKVDAGDDVTEFLGITKYEPPIPTHMNGQVFNAGGYTPKYDIENIKKYPSVLTEDEDVVITEKLHGTWACFGYHPEVDIPIVTSKGMSSKGLAFKWVFPENENNLYIRAFQGWTYRDINKDKLFSNITGTTIVDLVHRALKLPKSRAVYIMGEIYGNGVQDLHYDTNPMAAPKFRIFDIYVGAPGEGMFVGAADLIGLLTEVELPGVPVLYVGPWREELIDKLTNGKTTLDAEHIREGVVIKPTKERRDNELGRVVLKSVSEDYLLRKGDATEYN